MMCAARPGGIAGTLVDPVRRAMGPTHGRGAGSSLAEAQPGRESRAGAAPSGPRSATPPAPVPKSAAGSTPSNHMRPPAGDSACSSGYDSVRREGRQDGLDRRVLGSRHVLRSPCSNQIRYSTRPGPFTLIDPRPAICSNCSGIAITSMSSLYTPGGHGISSCLASALMTHAA